MNSFSNSGDLFSVTFLDNHITKRVQCGRTKAGNVAHFGLAPYFHELMLSKLSDCPYISLSFDKSWNSWVQKSQTDIIIWFWGKAWRQTVATRYIGSEFMGRSIVEDVLQTFLAGISDLHRSKILKVVLNGPKVDLIFLKFLAE